MKELFDYLELRGVTPNGLYTLWCLHAKTKSFLSKSETHTELRKLVNLGLVNSDYSLTKSGISMLEFYPKSVGEVPVVSVTAELEHIDRYLSVFPKGKLPSGKPARVNKKNLEESFKWFFKNYTYDWDTILRATFYYVETYEKTNYMYMKNSQYFIRKQNTDKSWDSELANYCEIIINGEDVDDSPHFTDKVV